MRLCGYDDLPSRTAGSRALQAEAQWDLTSIEGRNQFTLKTTIGSTDEGVRLV